MTRIWIASCLMLALSACSGSSGGADGAGARDSGAPPVDTVARDSGVITQDGGGADSAMCIPATSPGSSGMNAGQACLGCHANMGGNRRFTLAGTLYSNAAGSAKVGGATIHIIDANANVIDLATGSDGAFYTTQSIAFPISVTASKCPDTQTMPAKASLGDCNSCHNTGQRIHLP